MRAETKWIARWLCLLSDEQRRHTHTRAVLQRVLVAAHDQSNYYKFNSPSTHADDSKLFVLLLELSKESSSLSASSRADRMAQSNGTAVGVDLGRVQSKLADTVDSLASKGFVQLEDINVLLLHAAVFVEIEDGRYRSNAHLIRSDTSDLRAHETSDRLQPMGISPGTAREDRSRGTVGNLRPTAR